MHIIIPASFFKDLNRYLMQFYVPLPNSTSFIERSLQRKIEYILVKRLENKFFGQIEKKCKKIDEIKK